MTEIPDSFVQGVLAERGQAGQDWLAALPERLRRLLLDWNLQLEGPPRHGYLGLVYPVQSPWGAAALKLTWVDRETRHEARALKLWRGQGAVQLWKSRSRQGVLLLERLQADCSLARLPVQAACQVAGRLLRRLAIAAPQAFEALFEYAVSLRRLALHRWELQGRPFPADWLECPADSGAEVVVNQDHHFDNILAGQREPWLVIDPKVIRGDLEFGLAPLLWNRWEDWPCPARLEALVQAASLDLQRARGWTLFRLAEYALWAAERGLTQDRQRCLAIASTLRTPLP